MMKKHSFTLIELLVVIAVIIILVGLLLPALTQVRARAKFANCQSNLSEIAKAISMYRGDHEQGMPCWLSNLNPDYGVEPKVLMCPQDRSLGMDGGRPGKDASTGSTYTVQGTDSYSPADYGIGKNGSGDYMLYDCFQETDDTTRNNITTGLEMPRNPEIEGCSYMYEFAGIDCSWQSGRSWNTVKEEQLRMGYGTDSADYTHVVRQWDYSLFPAVRCFYHWGSMWGNRELVVNASYEGNIFRSKLKWEDGVYD